MPYALFQLTAHQRRTFIERHRFFVEQAKQRLLSQFEDLEGDADRAAEQWLEDHTDQFDPERHDPIDFQEQAYFHGVDVYQGLSELREQAKLLIVASMYHEWEKLLKEWHIQETRHWIRSEDLEKAVWKADFGDIRSLWKDLGWDWERGAFFSDLNACRLVTNVHKHGGGTSFSELSCLYPEYLMDPLKEPRGTLLGPASFDYRRLQVSREQIGRFSDAIVEFWQCVPEEVFDTQTSTIPVWFGTALSKGLKAPTGEQP